MNLRRLTVLTLVVATAPLSFAQGKSSKPTYTQSNVTATISNGNGSGAFAVQSDNPAGPSTVYCATSSTNPPCTASTGIGSFVGGPTGEFELDLSQQNSRVVYLNFSALTRNGSSPVIPVPYGYYNATIFSRCYDASGNLVDLRTIAAGTSNNNCSMRVNFTSGGQKYSFVMAPQVNLPSGVPATGRASAACNTWATDGTGCDNWTITPFASGANGTSADLIQIATNGKNVVVGSYSGDSFRIDLQR